MNGKDFVSVVDISVDLGPAPVAVSMGRCLDGVPSSTIEQMFRLGQCVCREDFDGDIDDSPVALPDVNEAPKAKAAPRKAAKATTKKEVRDGSSS